MAVVHLRIGDVPAEPVGDRAADDHAGAHEQDGDRGDAGGLVRGQAVGAAEVAGQPGEQRAGDEQLQAAADVGGDDRRGAEQGAQLGPLRRARTPARRRRASSTRCASSFLSLISSAVEHDQDQADDGHRGERPAPAELDGQRAAEGDAEHRAERAAGQEGAGERGAAVDREDGEDDGQADAAVGGLTDADEDAGEHQLLVVGRDRRAERWPGSRSRPSARWT